ncbi:MAG: hypothetical protein ABIH77_04865 [Pseudomonadota bacterium]|nr:hypothetical protein [Gammaproteobacteria bacterium]MBU1558746.1 hypothetical protein [Gammaproteobacteria bacterium]MBU1629134.1 hypothetical protein [Gammaproteobacteria bacterium]MBU1926649.1 hypothetical protein [Gammaproteobacteria bacterium]MBU2546645.1 hypothetical protein [Gammaproteobacteria bacterium]
MIDTKKLDKFVKEIDDMKKKNKMDLSSDQDLSVGIMDLISLEQHFFFSGAKTGNTQYYDIINEVRAMRKELMVKLIPHYQGEEWCISKHLLSASMRFMEVGTKQLDLGNKKDAYAFFQKSYDLYSLFWGINMKLIDLKEVKKIDEEALDVKDQSKKSLFKKLGAIVKHAVDCCIE